MCDGGRDQDFKCCKKFDGEGHNDVPMGSYGRRNLDFGWLEDPTIDTSGYEDDGEPIG